MTTERMSAPTSSRHKVVVIGAGFGGLQAVRHLAGALVDITLIDQRNHHLFQPLLYQVATASLSPSDIAWPIRSIFKNRPEVTTVLGTVTGVESDHHRVRMSDGTTIPYDTLILATGARHGYFGHNEWEPFAPGLKTIEDATRIRSAILRAFEDAERETDAARRKALLTFVIIGAGPTGVELAGSIADLARDTLPPDFRAIDTRMTTVLLVEAGPRVLPGYPEKLSEYALATLADLGVEVALGQPVTDVSEGAVKFGDRHVNARTILWAAGVLASPAAEWLKVAADRAGRLIVEPDLTVPGHPDIFAVGDTAAIRGPTGKPVPGIAPAAKQGGRYVASVIRARIAGQPVPGPFQYHHDGSLAQIGRHSAVIDFGWIRLRGLLAWWLWGIAHIFFLVGLRSRLSVALTWLWIDLRNQRSARLITQDSAKGSID